MLRDICLRNQNSFDSVCEAMRRFDMNPPRLHNRINWTLAKPTQELNYWIGVSKHKIYCIHIRSESNFRLSYCTTNGRRFYKMVKSPSPNSRINPDNPIKYPYFMSHKRHYRTGIHKIFRTVNQAKIYASTHNISLKAKIQARYYDLSTDFLNRSSKSDYLDDLISIF